MNPDRSDPTSRVRQAAGKAAIDAQCDLFEYACRAGQHPEIQDHLQRVPVSLRTELLPELIALEVEYRRRAGERIDISEYQRRFPEAAAAVQTAWQLLTSWQEPRVAPLAEPPARCPTANAPPPETPPTIGDGVDQPVPAHFDRYQIEQVLGTGGFGIVYRAVDPQLQRSVALKVPHRSCPGSEPRSSFYLHEARAAAQLKHPGLVAVYDVRQDCHGVYIVQEFVDGPDLAHWTSAVQPEPARIVRLMIEVVEAVGYAHQEGLVHRDLKPANILVDRRDHAHVADFGLALNESLQQLKVGETCGTPAYMSPEQVRGETHRLDGRSDLWSLGVILYELLTGRRPFQGDTLSLLFDEIQHRDPKPLRMINPELPPELERIALKCLAKRATDRYGSAAELADDLRAWLTHGDPREQSRNRIGLARSHSPRIVPKGLRSFDEDDKDFFLELLPGPRDRDGLPEIIRFWKKRIEQTETETTFAVGVMYGPSGCGKSSLVKAGLLPRLASHVQTVFVEATPNDTEQRLLRQLRKRIPNLTPQASLTEILAQLRDGLPAENQKTLLVLDQFEQWLHGAAQMEDSQLAHALRQCDGGRVQCLILVRDDFWLSMTRFMHALEIAQVENQNSVLVDLFDLSHAREVLRAYGVAYGRLPEEELTEDQQTFLDQAVRELACNGKVICVQLSLFADMMKGRVWTPATLQEAGGTSGVGVAFLDETFDAKTAPPTHRLHAEAAQAVLKALLPAVGTDIKGRMRGVDQLRASSGYADRPDDFRDLLRILDTELRLITPTDPDGEQIDVSPGSPPSSSSAPGRRFYQLTHDYLVPSLREWLTRKQKETRRGRAELRLAERFELWNSKPENRNLPSCWEYLSILLLTRRRRRTDAQQRMVRTAGRVHGIRVCCAVAALVLLSIGAAHFSSRHQLEVAVTEMRLSRGELVPRALERLQQFPPRSVADALTRHRNRLTDPQEKLAVTYALAAFGDVDHALLIEALDTANSRECVNIASALAHDRNRALQELREQAARTAIDQNWRLRTRLATVAMHMDDISLVADMLHADDADAGTEPGDPQGRTLLIEYYPEWSGDAARIAAALQSCEDAAVRSAMCLAVGSLDEPDTQTVAAWRDLLTAWYREAPDSGTHSAAAWAMRLWKLPLPELPDVPDDSSRWQITPTGLTLVRIPAGDIELADGDETTFLENDFWISACEVHAGLFQRFLNDPRAELPEDAEQIVQANRGDTSLPVVDVNWHDVARFCNWLSRQEGREPCYHKQAGQELEAVPHTELPDIWTLDPNSNGYRLPTEEEWEYACRAGTVTDYSFGDDATLLPHYGVFDQNAQDGPAPVGSKRCNAWGLFDMHGNVGEWCHGPPGQPRADRGGSWSDSSQDCRSTSRYRIEPDYRLNYVGFRVVLHVGSDR